MTIERKYNKTELLKYAFRLHLICTLAKNETSNKFICSTLQKRIENIHTAITLDSNFEECLQDLIHLENLIFNEL
jgi:hypothetical protein